MKHRKAQELLKLQIPLSTKAFQAGRPEYARDVHEKLTAVYALTVAFYDGVEAAGANSDLSAQGRRKEQEKVARATLEKLAEFERSQPVRLREQSKQISDALFKKVAIQRPTDPAERIAYEMRLREVRDELRKADDLERWSIYMGATDPLVLDAFETAPPILVRKDDFSPRMLAPLVDPGKTALARVERARKTAPEDAERIEAFEELASVYQGYIDTVRNAIIEETAVGQPDPIAERAAGE